MNRTAIPRAEIAQRLRQQLERNQLLLRQMGPFPVLREATANLKIETLILEAAIEELETKESQSP